MSDAFDFENPENPENPNPVPPSIRKRKRWDLLTIALWVFCFLGITAGAYAIYHVYARDSFETKRMEIGKVINQMNQIDLTASRRADGAGLTKVQNRIRQSTARLREIDTHRCPEDFREAFVKYIQTNDNLALALDTIPRSELGMLGLLIARAMEGKTDNGGEEVNDALKKAIADFTQGNQEFERFLTKYNIGFFVRDE